MGLKLSKLFVFERFNYMEELLLYKNDGHEIMRYGSCVSESSSAMSSSLQVQTL